MTVNSNNKKITLNSKNTGIMVINGTEMPYQVESQRQIEMFTNTLGVKLDEYYTEMAKLSDGKVLSNNKIAGILIWSALYAGAYLTTRTCDFDYDDVLDWYEAADESEGEEWAKPLKTFSLAIKKKMELLTGIMPTTQQTEVESKPMMTVVEQ